MPKFTFGKEQEVKKKKKKKIKSEDSSGNEKVKSKKIKKKKKVRAPSLEIHPDVKKVVAIRGDKNKFVRELSSLLTQRAGYPVRVIYQRSLDRKFDLKNLFQLDDAFGSDNALPFQRIVETDTPLGDNASFLLIAISDGVFKSEQLLSNMTQGMYSRW